MDPPTVRPARNGKKSPSERAQTFFRQLWETIKACLPAQNTHSLSQLQEPNPPNIGGRILAGTIINDLVKHRKYVFWHPDHYTITDFLGAGGQGAAALAIDTRQNNEKVVIKLTTIARDTPARDLQLITREVELLHSINRSRLLHLLDIFSPNKSPEELTEVYHVTKYSGKTLHELRIDLAGRGLRFKHESLSWIIYQILDAVSFLHHAGLVHRDLKPGNIAIDESHSVTILDMGLSRRVDLKSRLTTGIGTLPYMAPEILYELNGIEYDKTGHKNFSFKETVSKFMQ